MAEAMSIAPSLLSLMLHLRRGIGIAAHRRIASVRSIAPDMRRASKNERWRDKSSLGENVERRRAAQSIAGMSTKASVCGNWQNGAELNQ
jgi:hypothetical protein